MSVKQTDSELLERWKNGEDLAFEILYKRYAVQLLAVAFNKTSDRDLAEEFIQDVFLKLFLRKDTATSILNLSAFLYTTLKHQVIDHYRREKSVRKYQEQGHHFLTEIDNATIQEIELRELEAQIAMQVDGLPMRCKNVFVLSRNHCMTNKQIAVKLEISENTVEQHIRKALRILRSSMIRYSHFVSLFLYCALHSI